MAQETLIDGLGEGQNKMGFYAKAAGLAQQAISDKNGLDIDSTYAKKSEIPHVSNIYNAQSTDAMSGIAVNAAITSSTGNVPAVTSSDDGKILKASYSGGVGSFNWAVSGNDLPQTTSLDEGKVLAVTSASGTLGWVDQTQAQIQADWTESDSSSKAYIAHKPSIPTVNDSTVTVNLDSSSIGSFTTNQGSNSTINIPMATTTVAGAMSSADKGKLDGIASGAEVNVQSDWNQTSISADDYIKNKPNIPSGWIGSLSSGSGDTGVTLSGSESLNIEGSGHISVSRTNPAAGINTFTISTDADVNNISSITVNTETTTIDANKNVNIPAATAPAPGSNGNSGVITPADKKQLNSSVRYLENPYDSSHLQRAQQLLVVNSDQEIIDIVTQHSSDIDGRGTVFFVVHGI